MSQIVVNRIEELARRRAARVAQIEALPPQPPRADTRLWDFTRRPFVHMRTVGMMSRSVGKADPIKDALRSDTRIQKYITNNFPMYDLDELIVSPVLPSEIIEAISFQVATYDPSQPDEALLAQYRPAGYHISSELTLTTTDEVLTNDYYWTHSGPTLSAPLILREVQFNTGMDSAQAARYSIILEGYGVLTSVNSPQAGMAPSRGTSMKGLDRWYISGSLTPRIEGWWGAIGQVFWAIPPQIHVVAEPLIRIRE